MSPNAQAFLKANALSPVVSGYALEPDPRKPSKGVIYTLEHGRRFRLTAEECRSLPLPKWKGQP